MPTEQADPSSMDIDTPTDVYAFFFSVAIGTPIRASSSSSQHFLRIGVPIICRPVELL
jgi:hypothetical protein